MSRIRIAVDFESEEYAINWMAEAEASGLLRDDVPAVALDEADLVDASQEPVRRNWVLRRAGIRFGGLIEEGTR